MAASVVTAMDFLYQSTAVFPRPLWHKDYGRSTLFPNLKSHEAVPCHVMGYSSDGMPG